MNLSAILPSQIKQTIFICMLISASIPNVQAQDTNQPPATTTPPAAPPLVTTLPTTPPPDPTTVKKDEVTKADRRPVFPLFLFTGATVQNPYTIAISGNSGTLQKASTTTDGYIEAFVSARYISRENFEKEEDETTGWVKPFVALPGFAGHGNQPDLQMRLGYVFRGKSAPTNFNSQTVVGSSDVYGEVTMGFPMYRYRSEDGLTKGQASIEFSGAFATDRDFISVHPTVFIGGGYQLKDTVSGNPWYWISRVGIAQIDYPRLGSGSTVILDKANEPEFVGKWAPTIGTQLIYPINSTISFQAGANAYFTKSPASWNITFGLSLDPSKFFGK